MEKIFENWRSYKKENLKEITGAGGAHEERVLAAVQSLGSDMTPDHFSVTRQIASVADPTGVLSWPDVKESWDVVEAEPTYLNSGFFVLNVLGAIPVLGKVPQWAAKLGRLVGLVDAAKDAGKVIGTVKGGAKMADDVAAAAVKAEDAIAAQRVAGAEKAADIGQTGAKTAKAAYKLNRVDAMHVAAPGGPPQSYIIIQTANDGPVPFYRSSGTGEMADRVWVPHLGAVVKDTPTIDPTGLNRHGLLDIAVDADGAMDAYVRKLKGKHPDALTFTNPSGVEKTGKYVKPDSEMGQIAHALENQGAFTNVNLWNSPADFLSNNVSSLKPGMSLDEMAAQANRGFAQMDMPGVTSDYLQEIAQNLHMKSHGVNFNLSGMNTIKGAGGIPGINTMHTQEKLMEAFKLGSQVQEGIRAHKLIFENWRKFTNQTINSNAKP